MQRQYSSFSSFYDRYSPVLFGIALSITGSTKLSEEILIITFLNIRQHHCSYPHNPDIFFQLINLLILTTRDILRKNSRQGNFTMQRFHQAPILSKILFEQMDLVELCNETKMERGALGKVVREEVKGMLREKPIGLPENTDRI